MKIVLPGGSGQVGTCVARHCHARGDEVVVLSRTPRDDRPWRVVGWDGKSAGEWHREIDGADVVLNLAGRSVNCRYNATNRRLIKESRVDSVRAVGEAIRSASRPPRVWLQAATATIYQDADVRGEPNDEATGVLGVTPDQPDTWHFSYDVATSWEAATDEQETPHTRKVLLRSAMVMSPDRDGIFDTLLWLVRRGLGGSILGLDPYLSWIHELDFCRIVDFLAERDDLDGPVNVTSPNPVRYASFMRDLRRAYGQPIGLPAMPWMIEVGTRVLGTESELVLKSRRVLPGRLDEAGFEFAQPIWPDAAAELVGRWRSG
jgi:uncharacterized protein (TIGR01777 family)